jgi:hypothetical protein
MSIRTFYSLGADKIFPTACSNGEFFVTNRITETQTTPVRTIADPGMSAVSLVADDGYSVRFRTMIGCTVLRAATAIASNSVTLLAAA